ncbi:hypothetical protein ASPVEDRAFT_202889 [Aspergillus versicolor CBS 583.65]|uniref:Rhodopsin domain-containing protein n=1 Tax=Aspergillus versicolor CBS 583.65 TaxID=1036611 RepID=A0A1L9Q205_ASPVE|nr:uncharacterized protein ASPVEDRAFT_202889 [Aspergillus versicolor CBS 583.65]OJJ07817.1 hypothetical protein ASPVEDRAFT_202889 [Aspergillus versicolor CBS 583.65]
MSTPGLTPEQRQALLEGPASPPPPGQVSNLDDPPNSYLQWRALFVTLWTVASACVFIRIYAKAFVVRRFRMSDYTMVFAWALCMGYSALVILSGNASSGVDQWNLRLKDFILLLKYYQIGLVLFGVCSFFIKLSILLQLIEVFGMAQRDYFFWSCHCLIWINFIYYFIGTFITIFGCRPIAKAWDPFITHGSCIDRFALVVTSSALNAISDILMFVLPQGRIWSLRVPIGKRVSISAAFSFGLMACVSGVVKLAYAVIMSKTPNNTSYYVNLVGLWTIPEMAGGMIAGCLPSVPKVIQGVLRSPLVLKWHSSFRNLIPSYSRGQISAAAHSHGNEPMQRVIRNSFSGVDRFPLSSFKSPMGTAASTTHSVDSTAGSTV